MTPLLVGLISCGIGYVATDVWLASDRWRDELGRDQDRDGLTLAFAATALYAVLRLLG